MKNSHKGSALVIVITAVVVIALVLLGVWLAQTKNVSQRPPVTATSQQATSTTQTNPPLTITSVSPSLISAGQTLILKGTGFASQPSNDRISNPAWTQHSHMTVYIRNTTTDRQALLWEGNPTDQGDGSLSIPFPSKACTYSINDIGDPTCQTYLTLTPGKYALTAYIDFLEYVSPEVSLTVK